MANQVRVVPSLYRDGVGMILLNSSDQVFVARRLDIVTDFWQMPQGGIDAGEGTREAALRELAEEIGTSKALFLAESRDWLTYDLPPELVGKLWNGRYRGQRQKWFVLRFTGSDAEINLETKCPEFIEWKWVAPNRLPEITVPFKRMMYSTLLDEFSVLLTEREQRLT